MAEIPMDAKLALVKWVYNNQRMLNNTLTNNDFRLWDQAARASRGMGPNYDYGAVPPNSMDERGHLGDAGKYPNHITFSNQSNYANKINSMSAGLPMPGGTWVGNTFTPSQRQVNEHIIPRLQRFIDSGYADDTYINPQTGKPMVPSKNRRR